MPKGHKKKNKGVGVDFKKVKYKVGKKLPQAQNATDTTIKSKAISLPEQSIAADKTGVVVTHRNLTLKDLLAQSSHYNERIRLEALHGLTELLQNNPFEAKRHAPTIIAAISERTADADAQCRIALQHFYSKALFPALGKDGLQPFLPTIMGNICAAMTHLAEPIRTDTLGMLRVVMEWRADIVAQHYLVEILRHFSDQLSRPTRGRSLKAGSLHSLRTILDGLYSFLSVAIPALADSPTLLANKNMPHHTTNNINNNTAGNNNPYSLPVMFQQRCAWPLVINSSTDTTDQPTTTCSFIEAHHLFSLLLDCWRECSAHELEEQPEMVHAQCAVSLLQCCRYMLEYWGEELVYAAPISNLCTPMIHATAMQNLAGKRNRDVSSSSSISLATVLFDRIAVHFPVHEPVVHISHALREQLVKINVISAHVLSMFLPRVLRASSITLDTSAMGMNGPAAPWVDALIDWLIQVIQSPNGALKAALPFYDDHMHAPTNSENKKLEEEQEEEENSDTDEEEQEETMMDIENTSFTPHKDKNLLKNHQGRMNKKNTSTKNIILTQPTSVGLSTTSALSSQLYRSALTTAQSILPLLSPQRRDSILCAARLLCKRSNVKSTARSVALEFFHSFMKNPALTLYTVLPPVTDAGALEAYPQGDGRIPSSSGSSGGHARQLPILSQDEAARWITILPQHIWELGALFPGKTESALLLLLDCCRYLPSSMMIHPGPAPTTTTSSTTTTTTTTGLSSDGTDCSPLYTSLVRAHQQLSPLFALQIKEKKKKKKETKKPVRTNLVIGPLASLPLHVQTLALDCIYYLPGVPESILKIIALVALDHSCTASLHNNATKTDSSMNTNTNNSNDTNNNNSISANLPKHYYCDELVVRMIECISFKAQQASPSHYWGWLLTLLSGPPLASLQDHTGEGKKLIYWKRHRAVVHAACKASFDATASSPEQVITALGPLLLQKGARKGDNCVDDEIDDEMDGEKNEAISRILPLYAFLSLFLRFNSVDNENASMKSCRVETNDVAHAMLDFMCLILYYHHTEARDTSASGTNTNGAHAHCGIIGLPGGHEVADFVSTLISMHYTTLLTPFLDVLCRLEAPETALDGVDAYKIEGGMMVLLALLRNELLLDGRVWLERKESAMQSVDALMSSSDSAHHHRSGELKTLLNSKLGV